MGILSRIIHYVYTRSLPARAARSKGATVRNIEEAKHVGILFDGTEVDDRQTVLRYADKLRKQGKTVALLGYVPVVDKEATFSFGFFTQKEIDWAGRPKGDAIQHWRAQELDAFICLFATNTPFSESIALHTPANLKIGTVPRHPDCFDLMVDMKPSAKPQQIITQYEAVLAKTLPQAVA